MNTIRGIREFTVAISEKLKKNNWNFSSVYSRVKGMTFTLNTKLQEHITELNILQDSFKPEFYCQIAMDNHLIKSMVYKNSDDIEQYLNTIIETLEEIRDCNVLIEIEKENNN